jgi:DNA-binding transcriptional regulator YdaS (Cro superfamily)
MNEASKGALDTAIERAGGVTALARGLGMKSYAVVQQWRLNRVPAEHCPLIEALTGVRCEELRPDVRWDVLRVQLPEPATEHRAA